MVLKDRAGNRLSVAKYRRKVLDAVRAGIDERLIRLDQYGAPMGLSPDDLADPMLAAVPASGVNPLAALVGPFYDTPALMRALQTTKRGVASRVDRGSILAMRTSDGTWVYPTFQFEGHAVRDDLTEVLSAFRGHPGWSVATWLKTSHPQLDDLSPDQWLRDRENYGLVAILARRTAHQWSA